MIVDFTTVLKSDVWTADTILFSTWKFDEKLHSVCIVRNFSNVSIDSKNFSLMRLDFLISTFQTLKILTDEYI